MALLNYVVLGHLLHDGTFASADVPSARAERPGIFAAPVSRQNALAGTHLQPNFFADVLLFAFQFLQTRSLDDVLAP